MRELPESVEIETPEQVDISFQLAGVGNRFVAWTIDALIVSLCLGVLGIGCWIILGIFGDASDLSYAGGVITAVMIIAFFLLTFAYKFFFEAFGRGMTPGKWMIGVQVIKSGGFPADFTACGIRNVVRLVDFLPFFNLAGGIVCLVTRRCQRLGDLVAGTIVIKKGAAQAPVEPFSNMTYETIEKKYFELSPAILETATKEDFALIKNLWGRALSSDLVARRTMMTQIARNLAIQFGVDPRSILNRRTAEVFLMELYVYLRDYKFN